MACENCRYWQPEYAPYIKRMVMSCVSPSKKSEPGGCKSFKRRLPERPKHSTEMFRYKEDHK